MSLKVLFPEFVDSKDPKTQFEVSAVCNLYVIFIEFMFVFVCFRFALFIKNGREFIRNEYLSRKVIAFDTSVMRHTEIIRAETNKHSNKHSNIPRCWRVVSSMLISLAQPIQKRFQLRRF